MSMILLPLREADTAWSGFEPLLDARSATCRAQLAGIAVHRFDPAERQAAVTAGAAMACFAPSDFEPYHLPHMERHTWPRKPTEATLDRQIEAKLEQRSLPQLLLAKGAMSGPHRRRRARRPGFLTRVLMALHELTLSARRWW